MGKGSRDRDRSRDSDDDPVHNIRTMVVDDVLTLVVNLRCVGVVVQGEKTGSSPVLVLASTQGYRPFVGGNGCEVDLVVRRPLLGAHPDVLATLDKDYSKIYSDNVGPTVRKIRRSSRE